jgi:acylphosphatase
MRQAHIYISGVVQGTGFRIFIMEKAVAFGLHGWVKNRGDGKVEAIFQGRKVSSADPLSNHVLTPEESRQKSEIQ